MNITASVIYDEKTLKSFIHSNIYQRMNPKKCACLLLILSAVLLPPVIFVGYLSGHYWLLFAYLFLVVSELCMFLLFPRIQYNAQKKMVRAENAYVFTEDEFTVTSHGEGQSGTSIIAYSFLCRAKETSEYLYLYLNKQQAFIVDKSTMNAESVKMLREKLCSVLGTNYILVSY